ALHLPEHEFRKLSLAVDSLAAQALEVTAAAAAPPRPLKGTGISFSTVVVFVLPTLDFEELEASEQEILLLQEVRAAMAQFASRSLRIELGEAEEGVEVIMTIKNASSSEAKALESKILRAEENFLGEVEQRLTAAQIGGGGSVPQRATDLQVMVKKTIDTKKDGDISEQAYNSFRAAAAAAEDAKASEAASEYEAVAQNRSLEAQKMRDTMNVPGAVVNTTETEILDGEAKAAMDAA
ncbi:unnamed protein product, partial [Symbiodinium necroappetens]